MLITASLPQLSGAEEASPSALVKAYPEFVSKVEGNTLVLSDGTHIKISDGISTKGFYDRLEKPDIDDMFYSRYVPGKLDQPPEQNMDPGRVRYEPFFEKMYGNCTNPGEVETRLRRVVWVDGSTIKFTTVNGAADNLENVVADLKKLGASAKRYLVPAGGAFNCRAVAGTRQRSMHSYAVAIDINVKESNYWLWVPGAKEAQRKRTNIVLPYRNKIPFEIVEAFERHGFIWGGKWYHYDTMHFEYRPEFFYRSD